MAVLRYGPKVPGPAAPLPAEVLRWPGPLASALLSFRARASGTPSGTVLSDVKLSSTTRYFQTARLVLKLPTYARIVWGIERDRRTPIALKAILAAALAYVIFPIDLIPDAVPIIGQADDLTVLLLVLDLFIQNAPADVRAEHALRARNGTADLDRDLMRLRALMGGRFDTIRDNLPELLDRYGRLRNPETLKRTLASWRDQRSRATTSKELDA